ncbi:type II toxin-antitoxin system VapC family toxin [Mycolicibacterium tusciae]|uniref:type II toxin-antitoxin system VapC family toxin n=1 Tax=Mycolicibacterium tusciae TaxID=75922 RepID=UPI00024A3FF0|nr:PIN domain nuclease [Mycolicibacterium tusciae]
MIVIDTSAWIEYLRAAGTPAAAEVRRILTDRAEDVAMCEPVAMEILAGAGDDVVVAKLERLVNGLPSLSFDAAVDFRAAAQIYRAGRRRGKSIRSMTDCLIAAVAIRHDATVVHQDSDFDVIAEMTTLDTARADGR